MKKLLPVVLLSVSALVVGCGAKPVGKEPTVTVDMGHAPTTDDEEPKIKQTAKFMQKIESGENYDIWQDTRTGVEYFVCRSNAGNPAVTVMYNPNGEPFNDVQEAEEP